jgi:WD40 repeat protein
MQPQFQQITFKSKKGHKDQIVSLTKKTPSTFFSFSEDLSARLWDIRTCASVKLFSSQGVEEACGGSVEWVDKHHTVVCSSGKKIWTFDDRKCKILLKEVENSFENSGGEEKEISSVVAFNGGDNLAVLDDS